MEETEHQFSDIPQLVWFWVEFLKTHTRDNYKTSKDSQKEHCWHIYEMLQLV